MILHRLIEKELIHPPKWLADNTHYLTIMGSKCYGVSTDESDNDVYGFCIPTKEDVFPHLKGEILGFGKQKQRFEQWSEHHIDDKEARKQYDFAIYSIVKYFSLCMENNPNMIDSLFVRQSYVIHSTQIGNIVRENRRSFLHKGCWHKFKGYAYSQTHKMKTKTPAQGSKRDADIEKHGYDVKFAYHIVRLLNEAEQILTEGDLDLEINREQLKSIRRGEWKEQDIYDYFDRKEKELERVYNESKLPYSPDENKIKQLLLQCLEHHYGSLDKVIHQQDKYEVAMREIAKICQQNGL